MSPEQFAKWCEQRGATPDAIREVIHFAADEKEMSLCAEGIIPPPIVFPLAEIVDLNAKDMFGVPGPEAGFIFTGYCPNGDPVAIDVRDQPGSVWYLSHEESVDPSDLRANAVKAADDIETLSQGIWDGMGPYDYYHALLPESERLDELDKRMNDPEA